MGRPEVANNEYQYAYEWARRLGQNPGSLPSETSLFRMIALARGSTQVGGMNKTSALRAIATSYGKAAGNYSELQSLRSIVDVLGATPSGRNLGDLNSLDCLRAIVGATADESGGSVLAETTDWQAAVIAIGGTISPATLAAVNARIVAAKAHGYWDKFLRYNGFAGDQLAAAQVPWKVGGGNAVDTLVNFVGGDYSPTTGLTGNAGNKHLRTGVLANALTLNDTRLAVYNRTSGATGGNVHIGATDGANVLNLLAPYSDGTVYSDHYTVAAGRVSVAITGAAGCIAGTRTAANSHTIYRNGAEVATSATTGGALPALELFIFAQNQSGSPGLPSNHALASYAISAGFTAQQEADYAADEQAYQTLMGRQV